MNTIHHANAKYAYITLPSTLDYSCPKSPVAPCIRTYMSTLDWGWAATLCP